MNFEQSSSFMEEEIKRSKKKKVVITFIVLCSILILLMLALIGLIQFQDSQTLKMFINGTQVPTISETLYKTVDETVYVNVREIGEMLGYQYTQGDYNKLNQNESSCYLKNDYEVVSFSAEELSFKKYTEVSKESEELVIAEIPIVVKSENGQVQKYSLDNEVKLIDDMIYAPFEALPDMFNAQLSTTDKRINIYSLDQVVATYKNRVAQLKYSSMSGDYENLKAMLYGLAVVGDGTYYGVVSLQTGDEIVGIKCDDITFIPNLKDFLIEGDNTVGIVSSEGNEIIAPTSYDEISVYDVDNLLYLVKKDGKYGILNRLGEVIIYPDYDEIGYEFSEDENNTEEYKVIFEKCIPVKEGSKYGLYSIDGEELLPCVYDELGSALSEDEEDGSNRKPIFLIPPEVGVKGIIINQNGLYGLYDVTIEEIIIPIACTRAYSITKTAKTTYYVEHAGVQYNLEEYLEINNYKNFDEQGNMIVENNPEEDNSQENTNTSEDKTYESDNTVETSTDVVTTP